MSESRNKLRGQTSGYFIVYNRDNGEVIGRIRNLTVDGTMLIVDHAIETSCLIECQMSLPDIIEGCRIFHFDIECRWSQENSKAHWHEAGFIFANKTEKSRKIIDCLVNEWIKPEQSEKAHQPL